MDIIQIFDEWICPIFLIFIINRLNVDSQKSPKINHFSWGILEVEANTKPFKDAKLYPGGSREWDWNESVTRHVPGIQPADVEELGSTTGSTHPSYFLHTSYFAKIKNISSFVPLKINRQF